MKLISKEDKIFVAGHLGMAGAAICRSLHNRGYKNILKVERKELDLRDKISVENWFLANRPQVTIIAAAKVGGISANNKYPTGFLLDNLQIQNNLIESSWTNGIKRLLFLGSSCIYPKYAEQPIREEALLSGYLESTNESYAIAKIAGIKLCEALRKEHSFDAISLMPTNLYGPGDNYHKSNSHVLPAMIRRFDEAKRKGLESVHCWGSGNVRREFLHVDDLGDACLFALENWDTLALNSPKDDFGNPLFYLNVGTGKDITIKELAELISLRIGYKGSILWDTSKPDGTPQKKLYVARMTDLGWQAKISFEEGLKSTLLAYYQELHQNKIRY